MTTSERLLVTHPPAASDYMPWEAVEFADVYDIALT